MEYINLGKSGLKVSKICLGCMSYGDSDRGGHPWVLNEEDSRHFIKRSLDLGINFFDTANAYSFGSSEEFLGRAINELTDREEVVIATKVYLPMEKYPNSGGLSRKAIMREVDASLKRLGTDYIDLYQIHRWDYSTPIEETMEALHDVVKSGKVRYIGASSMYAWQFCKALYIADKHNWTRFISMQNHYNLINREEEREMLALCKDENIGVIPWSPLARGKLAREWNETETARTKTDIFAQKLYGYTEDADRKIVEVVTAISKERGIPQAQIALAWLLHKSVVSSPIIGATKAHHLEDAVLALSVKLSVEEINRLEENYIPHPVLGFS